MLRTGVIQPVRPHAALCWLAWAFTLPGLGMIAGAGVAAWLEMSFRSSAVETQGEVVRMIQRGTVGGRGSNLPGWTPVFAFRLPDGQRIEVEAGYSTSPPCCRAGDQVTVRYDPTEPGRARMDGFMESWFAATMLGAIGLAFLILGQVAQRLMRRVFGRIATPMRGNLALRVEARLAGLRREATALGPGWVVQARGIDPRSGTERIFESAPLPFDPTPQMTRMGSVAVFIDPMSPGEGYSMDLSFLRPPAGPVPRG